MVGLLRSLLWMCVVVFGVALAVRATEVLHALDEEPAWRAASPGATATTLGQYLNNCRACLHAEGALAALDLLDLAEGRLSALPLLRRKGGAEQVQMADISDDGRTGLTASGWGTVSLWTLETGVRQVHIARPAQAPDIEGLALLPDSRHFIVLSNEAATLWDGPAETQRRQWLFSADGGEAHAVQALRADTLEPEVVWADATQVSWWRADPRAGDAAPAPPANGEPTQKTKASFDVPAALVAGFDDRHIVAASSSVIQRWQRDSHELDGRFEIETFGRPLALSDDGREALFWRAGAVEIWNTRTGTLKHTWKSGEREIEAACKAKDDAPWVLGSAGGEILLLANGNVLRGWRAHRGTVDGLACSGSGRVLSIGRWHSELKAWDMSKALPQRAPEPSALQAALSASSDWRIPWIDHLEGWRIDLPDGDLADWFEDPSDGPTLVLAGGFLLGLLALFKLRRSR